MKSFRNAVCLIMAALLCLTFASCAKEKPAQEASTEANAAPAVTEAVSSGAKDAPVVTDAAVIHETEFGGVYIDLTIDAFNALGFAFGDSVDIAFSNGYKLEDLPYYNGYYTSVGDPLLVGYPGYPHIRAGFNNGADLWLVAGLSDTDTASVTLREAGKYLDVQNARDIHYTDVREDYPSDEAFANFRMVAVGGIAQGVFYRGASACDNQHNRATYVNDLIEKAGVKVILDLADNDERIEGYFADPDFACPYFKSVRETGGVIPLAMNMNYGSDEFRAKVVSGLTQLAESEGPFYVHCTEGKDRTGFVCMLLEAFAGATYQELVDDYMLTYDNYYKINQTLDKARYDTIREKVFDDMVKAVVGSPEIRTADMAACAEQYLLNAGMDAATIEALRQRLTKASS